MKTKVPFFKRKTTAFFSFFLILFAAVFVLRDQMLVLGTKAVLNKTFPKTHSYQSITAEKEKISIRGLQIHEKEFQCILDEVTLGLEVKKFFTEPQKFVCLMKKGFSHWVQNLVFLKQYGMHLSIDNGVMQLGENRYYFQVKQGQKHHELGTVCISQDPYLLQHPFFTAHIYLRAEQLITQLHVEEVSSERLMPLIAFACPNYFGGFEKAQGTMELSAVAIFENEGKISELSTRFSCADFEVTLPQKEISLRAQSFSGDLNYPEGAENVGHPIWKRMLLSCVLENGNISIKDQITLSQLQGYLSLDPREDPTLSVKGELTSQEKPLALALEGKGAAYEDHAYFLEFGLELDDYDQTKCEAFLTLCRPEKENLVVQLEANRLLPNQVEMIKNYCAKSFPRLKDWEVVQGTFGGKLVALIEQNALSHFEVQDLEGENVILLRENTPLYFTHLKGEGRLFDDLSLEMDFPISHFFGWISSDLKTAYEDLQKKETAHLTTQVKFGTKDVETLASIQFVPFKESIQFGFKSDKAFPSSIHEIREGWAHSEKLSENLYAPLLFAFSEDVEMCGDIHLVATCNEGQLECALQMDDFLFKQPRFDVKASSVGTKEQTLGRAKVRYDISSQHFEGVLPLQNALVYERFSGVCLKHLDGELIFSPQGYEGKVAHADLFFDGQCLVKKSHFDFAVSEEKQHLKNGWGQLPLATDKEFLVQVPKWEEGTFELTLWDGKTELARYTGNQKGQLFLQPLSKNFDIQWEGNPLSPFFALDLSGDEMHVQLKKEKDHFLLEECKIQDLLCKGSFTATEEGFSLSHFEVDAPQTRLQGSGTFALDLPQSQQSFGVRCTLMAEGTLQDPISMPIQTKYPFKIAFSPDLGIVLSDLDVISGENHCHIEQFEKLFSTNKTHIRQCKFEIQDDLLDAMYETKNLPEFLRDVRFCKNLQGEIHLDMEGEKGTVNGMIKDFPIGIEWDKKECKVRFSEGERELCIQMQMTPEKFLFKSIQGSFGGVEAHLKKDSKENLRGTLSINPAQFEKLFDVPLNRYFQLWKVGQGYRLDGTFSPDGRLSDWTFKGKVKGQNFECYGVQVRSLEARVDMEPGLILIENLDVTDEAGKMWIGEGSIVKEDEDDWIFSFPTVEIRGLQPSFIHQMEGKEQPISPLIIKTATLHNVRGKMDDLASMTGFGSLRFTNRAKNHKAHLPKSLPEPFLEQIGWEGTLLIPSEGEMDFALADGRCYLSALRKTFGDQNRSEFLPLRKQAMGYLDFHGNWMIDLQVKQKNRSSRNSSLSLSVRGTWEEPEFFIR